MGVLQWIITNETGWIYIMHFLDDFPLLGTSMSDVTLFITDFYKIMDRIRMPIAKAKTLRPTAILEYLGLVLNFFKQTVGIPEKKCEKCLDLINKLIQVHKSKSKVTVTLIQKTAGSLNFICQALPAG